MKNLSIKFIRSNKYTAIGQITINDFKEKFEMSLDAWNIVAYEKQWKEGLERIKTHNTSALITDIRDLDVFAFVNWWVLYREDNKIFIRNQILIDKKFEKRLKTEPFNHETCYNFIDRRIVYHKDKPSEWVIHLNDLDNI